MNQQINQISICGINEVETDCMKCVCIVLPGSSVGRESTCNAGDPGLVPGSGRSPGTGIGYPLWYSWASLVAQLGRD